MNPISRSSSTNRIVTHAVQSNLNSLLGALTQLSSGDRINRGSSDPVRLLAAAAITSQLDSPAVLHRSSLYANALRDLADCGLAKVARLIGDIRSNLIIAAGCTTTNAERAALQIAIDGALDAIDLVGQSTYNQCPVFSGQTIHVNYGPDYYGWDELHLPKIDCTTLGDEECVLADLRSGGKCDLESGDLASALKALNAVLSRTIYARIEYRAFDRYSHHSVYELLSNQGFQLASIYSELLEVDYLCEADELARTAVTAPNSIPPDQPPAAEPHTPTGPDETLLDLNRR